MKSLVILPFFLVAICQVVSATEVTTSASAVVTVVCNPVMSTNCPPPGDATILWSGRDLAGWKTFFTNADVNLSTVWSASNSVLRLSGKPNGYLRTENTFSNYQLHVEWRWPETNGNSGVFVHLQMIDSIWPKGVECQLKTGAAGELVGNAVDFPAPLINGKKRAKITSPSENPLGQWNAYDIFCRGNSIEVYVNGARQNTITNVTVQSGGIGLQSEGYAIEFRNIWLRPLLLAN